MIIDLCCGIGRFESEEDIISIDIDPKTKPTIVADIRFLPLRPKLRPRLCHASPPCKYLSLARANRYGYDEKGIAESLRLIAACLDAFVYLEAKTWTLENPLGLLRRFIPRATMTEYANAKYNHKRTDFFSNNRALARAFIPKHIRQKLLDIAN